MFDKDGGDVCGQYQSVRRVAECMRLRNTMEMTDQSLSKCAVPVETV